MYLIWTRVFPAQNVQWWPKLAFFPISCPNFIFKNLTKSNVLLLSCFVRLLLIPPSRVFWILWSNEPIRCIPFHLLIFWLHVALSVCDILLSGTICLAVLERFWSKDICHRNVFNVWSCSCCANPDCKFYTSKLSNMKAPTLWELFAWKRTAWHSVGLFPSTNANCCLL